MRHRKRSGSDKRASVSVSVSVSSSCGSFAGSFVWVVSYRIVSSRFTERRATRKRDRGHASVNARVSSSVGAREQRGEGIGVQRAAEVPSRARASASCVGAFSSRECLRREGEPTQWRRCWLSARRHPCAPRADRRDAAAAAAPPPVSAPPPRREAGSGRRTLEAMLRARDPERDSARESHRNRGTAAGPPTRSPQAHLIPKTAATGRAPERHRRRSGGGGGGGGAHAQPTPGGGEAGEEVGFP